LYLVTEKIAIFIQYGEKMNREKNPGLLLRAVVCLVFILHFIYFAVFNRYHLAYQEQIQLFRFDYNYFKDFLIRPTGIAEYVGAFFIQFYLSHIAAAIIVTLASFIVFLLFRRILKRFGINGILWQLIPVFLLAILQSDYVYYLGYTIGFLLVIFFFSFYITLANNYKRFFSAVTGVIFLYILTGEFAVIAATLVLIYELLYVKGKLRLVFVLLFLVVISPFHYLLFQFIYILPRNYLWIRPIFLFSVNATKVGLIFFLALIPLLLVLSRVRIWLFPKLEYKIKWNWKPVLVSLLLILICSYFTARFVYDYKTELLLGIDNNVQKSNWNRSLKLSSKSPAVNQIVIYLTNIALYKSGLLGDMMFNFNQIGTSGLWLGWGNEATPFFGNEVFYQLGYINEAYRWAFEAMAEKGQAPRLMKRLALTSMINGDYKVAEKYINVLGQTLFYRKWAKYYKSCINDPVLMGKDKEIMGKRLCLVHNDFLANVNDHGFELQRLLDNCPGNRMAYEYYMSYLLLGKDIETFGANIYRLSEFGFKEIPVHYEEALLVYMNRSNSNIVPEGFFIRESTKQRFNEYFKTSASYTGNPQSLPQFLSKRFGKTYWYYLQFR